MGNDEQNDVADENTVDDIISTSLIAELPGPSVQIAEVPAISNEQWLIAAQNMNISNVSGINAQTMIAEFVRIGIKSDTMIRNNAKKISIAAEMGNMDSFIDGLPYDAVVNHLKNATVILEKKGLTDQNRLSVAADPKGGPAISSQRPSATAGADAVRTPADILADSKSELRSSGRYGF